jgi:CubicO group peptidase (beta-lactamase class C family)
MKKKKLLAGAMAIGSIIAIARTFFAKTSGKGRSSELHIFDEIDQYIEGQMHRLHIPGAALAIVEGDQITHMCGFGHARPGGEAPTPQTPFFIGSVTKSITALAVMQLVEAGKVELDAPVRRYLPWFRVADTQASAQITIRHLLYQTSGLPLWPSEIALHNFDDSPDAIERQVRELASLKLKHQVGEAWEYSNFNYNILGLVVESASGETYTAYIQNHILDPLEMRHSYISKANAQQDGLATGHQHWFSLPFPAPNLRIPVGSLPSGQLISCAEDLAHYLIAHLNGGRFRETQILSADGIAKMHQGVMEIKMGEKSEGFYGMGWFDIDLGATKTYSHGGNVPDFAAHIGLLPEHKRAVAILFNANPYGLPLILEEVGIGVTALLAEQQPPPIKLDFIQWIARLLPLIPVLQVYDLLATLRKVRRWEKDPALEPRGAIQWGEQMVLPLFPHLLLASVLVYLRSSGFIRYLDLFNPDVAWTARISGTLAGIWALLRSGLMIHAVTHDRR